MGDFAVTWIAHVYPNMFVDRGVDGINGAEAGLPEHASQQDSVPTDAG